MLSNTKIRNLAKKVGALEASKDQRAQFIDLAERNGYTTKRGAWIYGPEGMAVSQGWTVFANNVADGFFVLVDSEPEPAAVEPIVAGQEVPDPILAELTRINEAHPIRQCGAAPAAQTRPSRWARTLLNIREGQEALASQSPVFHADHVTPAGSTTEITYLYTTRTPTISLTSVTSVQVTITETATARTEGACVSGAALDCAGEGFLRVVPESMLPNNTPEQMIQCLPCYEAGAAAYVRKLHGGE